MTVTAQDRAADDVDDLPEQLRIRREKYDRLSASAGDAFAGPFPVGVARTHSLAQIRAAYPELAADAHTGVDVGVAGRVIFVRNSGKLCFATLREDGVELQVMLSADRIGVDTAGGLDDWKHDVDLGDLVFVHGEVITSKRGELSVLADRWQARRCARFRSRTARCRKKPGCANATST
jgi:lysyl-tRNA synthetase, class II